MIRLHSSVGPLWVKGSCSRFKLVEIHPNVLRLSVDCTHRTVEQGLKWLVLITQYRWLVRWCVNGSSWVNRSSVFKALFYNLKKQFLMVAREVFKWLIHHQAHLANLKLPGGWWSHWVVRNSRSSRNLMVLYWYLFTGSLQKVAHRGPNCTLVFFQCALMDSQEKPRESADNISSDFSPFDTVTQLDHTNVFCPNMMDLQQRAKRLLDWSTEAQRWPCWCPVTGKYLFHFKEGINGGCKGSCRDLWDSKSPVSKWISRTLFSYFVSGTE